MDSYQLLKLLHILGAIVLIGTGGGIAFFMWMAYRSKNIPAIAVTAKHVVLADWLFTAPAVLAQLVTGIMLMQTLGYTFDSPWFLAVITLFALIGLCWLPVVFIQYKLRALAERASQSQPLGKKFSRLMAWWTWLGISAFTAILIILWLMVIKPLPVVGS